LAIFQSKNVIIGVFYIFLMKAPNGWRYPLVGGTR
jgi:hypothetical protein